MSLRILCDENIPRKVSRTLRKHGHEITDASPGTNDQDIARQAKTEKRIILTFDSDFANILAYPPENYVGIIRINIHPQIVSVVLKALDLLFAALSQEQDFRGKLIILQENGWEILDPTEQE